MTVIIPESVTCTICDCISEQPILKSTNTFFGEPDLDLRPPELMRSTINTWVQTCPDCGYCYPNISFGDAAHKPVVSSKEYKDQLKSGEYPSLANAFLCLAQIYIPENIPDLAGLQFHYAAWVCDDENLKKQAAECRKKAIARFGIAKERGIVLTDDKEFDDLVLADLHRRTGQFENALKYCESGLQNTRNSEYNRYYLREMDFIHRCDTQCHTLTVDESRR